MPDTGAPQSLKAPFRGLGVSTSHTYFRADADKKIKVVSGGEKARVALAKTILSKANFLLLDEPSEGLAPVIVKEIGELLKKLKQRGYTIILVEQNWRFARSVADRHVVVEHGQVVDTFTADVSNTDVSRVQRYLGV